MKYIHARKYSWLGAWWFGCYVMIAGQLIIDEWMFPCQTHTYHNQLFGYCTLLTYLHLSITLSPQALNQFHQQQHPPTLDHFLLLYWFFQDICVLCPKIVIYCVLRLSNLKNMSRRKYVSFLKPLTVL